MSRVKTLAKKLLPWLAYGALFWVAFVLFAYLTFPYDRLRDFLVQEVEQPRDARGRRHDSGTRLEIVDLSPSWFTGVEATGVRIVKQNDDADTPPAEMTITELGARVSLLSLLMGDVSVSYAAELAGGRIEGEYEEAGDAVHVTADVQGVRLRRVGLIRSALGLPMRGTTSGQVDLTVSQQVRETQGRIALRIAGLELGDGRSKLALPGMGDGLTIETVRAGDLELDLETENGVAQVRRLTAHGEDAEIDGSGSVQLLRPLAMSRLDLLIRLKFLDSYKEKSDRTRALFALLDMNPRVRPARTSDGALQYRLSGSLGSRIQPTPARNAPAPGSQAADAPD